MIKEAIFGAIIGGVFPAGLYLADARYETIESAELQYASIENAIKKSSAQQRIYSLQDEIKKIKRRAARLGRDLMPSEKNDVEELQREIDNLKGW